MLLKSDFLFIFASYFIAFSCIWFNATAHMQRYSESGEYAAPQSSRYRNQQDYQRQETSPQRGRQTGNNRNAATNYEFGQGQNQLQQQQLQQQQLQQQQLQQQQLSQRGNRAGVIRANENQQHGEQNKCRIWVPMEIVDKYELAHTIQVDQKKQQALILICCTGYAPILWRGQTRCRPLCENCPNGICISPGECQCYEEYVKNDNGDCIFTCPLGCLNGRCYLDGSCQCEAGYKLDETRKFCRPICSGGCGFNTRHNCTEPEVCSCAKGYQLTDAGCQPVCQPECGVGGICRDNNECDCGPGYTIKDGVCQSDCYQKCDNGICVSRNRCICNPGYTYHERSTQCVPV